MNLSNHEPDTRKHAGGFTAIELIMVIVVLAILGFVVGTRFNRSEMSSIVAADQLVADIRYVQLRAMSIGVRQSIEFTAGSGDYEVVGEKKTLPKGITITGTTFGNTLEFNTLGEPIFGPGEGHIILSEGNHITIQGITGRAE